MMGRPVAGVNRPRLRHPGDAGGVAMRYRVLSTTTAHLDDYKVVQRDGPLKTYLPHACDGLGEAPGYVGCAGHIEDTMVIMEGRKVLFTGGPDRAREALRAWDGRQDDGEAGP
jgi:hypothetical protein